MIIIKNKAAIEKMRVAGQKLAGIMEQIKDVIQPGVSTYHIDSYIEKQMNSVGLKPECKGYGTYKHATCISLNEVVVHGIPSHDIILKDGDFVKVDVVGSYKGYCADMARYFFVGDVIDKRVRKIADVAQEALDKAIVHLRPGVSVSDISAVIQDTVESAGFAVVRDFVGHGIGKSMHEPPEVPNFTTSSNGPTLRQGMTLAIEPMITEQLPDICIDKDGWTARTVDGGLAAHVEDTVVVTSNGSDILTRLSKKEYQEGT